ICDLNIENETNALDVKERSGYRVIQRIRKKDVFIPIILFTASEKTHNYLEIKKLGIEGYFNKPGNAIDEQEVRNQVLEFIQFCHTIEKNKFIHHFWQGYTLIMQINTKRKQIKDKIFSILLKLYNTCFFVNSQQKILSPLTYNEIILYLHNIINDIIKESNPEDNFGRQAIDSRIYFKDFTEVNMLLRLNELRNSLNLIHGNSKVDLAHVICYINLIYYLLMKQDQNVLKVFRKNVRAMILPLDKNRNDIKDLIRLWKIESF
ncbi:MAG TPA: response regulator, partial [Candidatus Cloacimonadota bacterium]|nr:response regulator [Candidatus Cloacimonadota bacterium]